MIHRFLWLQKHILHMYKRLQRKPDPHTYTFYAKNELVPINASSFECLLWVPKPKLLRVPKYSQRLLRVGEVGAVFGGSGPNKPPRDLVL